MEDLARLCDAKPAWCLVQGHGMLRAARPEPDQDRIAPAAGNAVGIPVLRRRDRACGATRARKRTAKSEGADNLIAGAGELLPGGVDFHLECGPSPPIL